MIKRLLLAAFWLPLIALAQSYPSPTYNNVTVQGTLTAANQAFTNPLPVTSGGTGRSTMTQYSVVVGGTASTLALIGPTATSGIPLVSQGSAAYPQFSTAVVAGGGTGQTTLTAHGVLFGEGTAAVNQSTAGTAGQPLLSGGASADPNWGTLNASNGGTGLTTITAHGIVLGEGTSNVSTVGPCATTGQTVISQGASADPICGYPTGALIGVQTFTSSGTYTPTSGTASVIVAVQAPGGGGGGVAATGAGQVAQAQSGSGGSYAKVRITSGFSGATITIGSTGTGGAAGTNAGTSGGTTSFGTIVSCPGGVGGAGSAAVTPPSMQSAAAAPSACTVSGATTLVSTAGGVGQYSVSTSATSLIGAMGGASGMGTGSGLGNGSGGNGAAIAQSTGAAAGGNATAGKIIVFEYD